MEEQKMSVCVCVCQVNVVNGWLKKRFLLATDGKADWKADEEVNFGCLTVVSQKVPSALTSGRDRVHVCVCLCGSSEAGG